MSEQNMKVVPVKPVRALEQFLAARASKLAQWAAGRLDPASLIRFMLLDYSRSKKLQACTPESIYCALLACAQTGLEPGALRQHAFVIPYKGIATFMIGWRGFVHLARRSKIQLTSELVFVADMFKPIKGTNRQLIHEPSLDESPLRGAYALAESQGDLPPYWDYMGLSDLQKVRDFAVKSRGGELGAYELWEEQMFRKAPIRRVSKFLPLGEDYLLAREIDQAAEVGDLQTYKTLVDPDGELPDFPEPAQLEDASETRGVAGAKAQIQRRAKQVQASETPPPDSSPAPAELEVEPEPEPVEGTTVQLAEQIRGFYRALETILQNPELLPMVKAQVERLPECPDRPLLLKQIQRAERMAKEDAAKKDPRGG